MRPLVSDSPLFPSARSAVHEEAKRNETKMSLSTAPEIAVLLVHRNHRAPRPGPSRPGIACCNVDSEGMEAGLGASRCSWDGFSSGSLPGHWLFMKPRSKLRDTTKRYRVDRRTIDCLAVTSTNTLVYPFHVCRTLSSSRSKRVRETPLTSRLIRSSNVGSGRNMSVIIERASWNGDRL